MKKIIDVQQLKKNKFLDTRLVFCMDIFVSVLASIIVLLLINTVTVDPNVPKDLTLPWLSGAILATIITFWVGRTYRSVIRYSTLREVGKFGLVCLAKDVFIWLWMMAVSNFPPSSGHIAVMIIFDYFATLSALILTRIILIAVYDRMRAKAQAETELKRVLIYGVSDKAASTVTRLINSTHYLVLGIIAPGGKNEIHRLANKPVYYFRSGADVGRIAALTGIDGILFPYIQNTRDEKDSLMVYCKEAELKTWVIPDIDEITGNQALGNFVRKVKIEDLLGRPEINISMDEIIADFKDKVVMVTGAAGSIGSELCRQLATFGVKKLILFDNAETPLHYIRLEIEDRFPDLDFVPVIGDVRSLTRLDCTFHRFHPQIVFHAAAYKHVPLMEENPCEAVQVNVNGSRNVADKCVEYDVEKMVMISTDKAVNPTNIMGCTKRLAEIYVQSLGLAIERGDLKGRTRFITTRFGNVLGSNGSVIPRFREQIEHGGPVTVTHPEIRRFFMTIPEACRLVMEAATFATGTQIFVFDMGESVKIATLAERMISLAGLKPGEDIKIEFTGLRPGEKLYEEVLATKENTIPTMHERIFVAKVREYDYSEVLSTTTRLGELANAFNIPNMVILMKRTVPEFKSKHSEFEKYDIPD